ncbi:MFS transporter, OPA family, solute carrier family 37, member 1/2 [Paragonimus westermani]|uniref:Sugar phosphate exchanger 3 n=1 Tax=Paragonimus westermani TaxID=34504 RepID=A0A5J4P0W9_9TREM|nr:MFS transporter, OPA family, solute carrier family 37, member 1/2 [Paragonimus westermani]
MTFCHFFCVNQWSHCRSVSSAQIPRTQRYSLRIDVHYNRIELLPRGSLICVLPDYAVLFFQLVSGVFQSMGWPAVVASMGNWFGRARRGMLFGVWNTHGSTGNIVGSVIAGAFVDTAWGWSFIVPGILIIVCGLYALLCLVPYPEEVGVEPPEREITKEVEYVVAENFTEDTLALSMDLPGVIDSKTDLTKGSISATKPVSIITALRVPGVVEYSLCLFFAKLVSYTFLFWLPKYIRDTGDFDPSTAADLSSLFDLGGIIGGILAGVLTDWIAASATVCSVMLLLGVPLVRRSRFLVLYVYYVFGAISVATCVGCLIPLGMLVNGPFGLITTAVAADLGTHPSLRSDTRALATVTGIIDGTGSMGEGLILP